LADKLVVHNPMGFPPRVTAKPLAPRVDTLDGKTVYLVDCRFDDSDIFLKQMKGWFEERMPSVDARFVQIRNVYTKTTPRPGRRSRRTATPPSSGLATEVPVRRQLPCTG
jgi:hypothetical protein